MKLSDIEDVDKLVTKDWLDVRLLALEDRLSAQFHKELWASTKWAIGIMAVVLLGFGGLIMGGVYFVLTNVKPS